VRVQVRQGRVRVTTDLGLPGGRARPEDLDVHVAFGAPGVPLAFDAQLLETPRGYLVAPADATGTRLSHEPSLHAPPNAAFGLGRRELAGRLVHVPRSVLADKLRPSGQVTLRLREVRPLPPPLADGARELVVRLGAHRGKPFVLGLLEMASDEPIARVDARFCGPGGSGDRLFVAAAGLSAQGAAPPLVERQGLEDLCLRFGPPASR
jgi:hypothetical protein